MYRIIYKYKSAYHQDIVHAVNCSSKEEADRICKQIEIIPDYIILNIEEVKEDDSKQF